MPEWLDEEKLAQSIEEAWTWVDRELLSYQSVIQLGVVVLALALAIWLGPRLRTWLLSWEDLPWSGNMVRLTGRVLGRSARAIVGFVVVWVASTVAVLQGWQDHVLRAAVSLLGAWIVIRALTMLIRNPFWARIAAAIAWTVAALNIFKLLEPTSELLRRLSFSIADVTISVFNILQAVVILILLIWLAIGVSSLVERQVGRSKDLSRSSQVLIAKSARIILIAVAIFVAIDAAGVDLSALAFFGGALGVGLGFGLQKIVSNFVSGIILLADKSIKPGDVIAIDETYGWIQSLNARYVSVLTRDGIEILIPNEELITNRVENWSYSDTLVRIKLPVGVSYNADVEKAIDLCLQAVSEIERVIKDPAPRCLLKGFGDSSVDLELRIWITDPQEGRANVCSEVYLRIWQLFHEHDIEIPFPQRDLHLRSAESLPVRLDRGEADGK